MGPVIPTPEAPKLELDYDKVDRFEQERQLRIEEQPGWLKKTMTGLRAVRKPSSTFGYVELALAPLLGLMAFTFFTAQFPAQGSALRMLIGGFPLLLGLIFASIVGPMHTALTRARCFNIIALAIVVLAHVWDPATLKTEMFREPAWYLAGYKETAGLGTLHDLITSLSRSYIKAISAWLT